MGRFVISLDTVPPGASAVVGGKAAPLAALHAAGFPVPPGLCLTAAAFDVALALYRDRLAALIHDHDLHDPHAAQVAAGAIAVLLGDLTVPEAVADELRGALPAVASAGVPLAVRSSATAEDRADVSFAGQYETVVGVVGEAAVLAAIVTCWRSFFSAHALAARAAAGATRSDEAMAVLIQRLVEAECAGVCFSVDPVRQRRETIVIDAVWGLGVGAVDGNMAADTYRVDRTTFTIDDRRIVEKPEQIVPAADGGAQRRPVPDERRRAACLPDQWVQRIAEFAIAAEDLFGSPQDVEWAVADGQVWIVQSRPITTLPAALRQASPFPVAWESDADRRRLWRLEAFGGNAPQLPLELEVTADWGATWGDAALIKGEPGFPHHRIVNGRHYGCLMPTPLRPGDRRVREAAYRGLVARVHDQGLPMWEFWAPEVVAETERLGAFDVATADGRQIADHLEDAFGAFRRHWTVHWLQGMFFGGPSPRNVATDIVAAVSGLSGPAVEALVVQITDGEETIFTRLVDGLYTLAQTARAAPAVAALVAAPPPDVLDRLAGLPEAAAFRAQLDQFLAVYGGRTGGGFGSGSSVRWPTWREQPHVVLALAAPYLDSATELPAAARARALAARDARVEALCAACADEQAVAELRRCLPFLRRQRTGLENHNHYIDQMSFGQLRGALLIAARRLVERGVVASVDDIFWLHRDEIVAALGTEAPAPLTATVAARQAEHALWAALAPPPILGVPPATLDPRPPLTDALTAAIPEETGRLVGQAASPGRRRGRARIIPMGTMLPVLAPGDVLVAENAGPLWTPLFPILAGVVLDQGVVMQHAATTAREYGVPAVVGTGNATRRIPDGAWVVVDGEAGTVELEAPTGSR